MTGQARSAAQRQELLAALDDLGAATKLPVATTASADADYRDAWEASVKVVAAAGRFVEAERDGNAALIEDAHFGLLRALADYRAGAK